MRIFLKSLQNTKIHPNFRGVNSKIHPNFRGEGKLAKYLKIKDISIMC